MELKDTLVQFEIDYDPGLLPSDNAIRLVLEVIRTRIEELGANLCTVSVTDITVRPAGHELVGLPNIHMQYRASSENPMHVVTTMLAHALRAMPGSYAKLKITIHGIESFEEEVEEAEEE